MINTENRHKIKSILFDVIFDDDRRAQELYDQIRHIHYNSLESVICQCIDEVSSPEKITKIKKIELNLGEIEYGEIKNGLTGRTREALMRKLKDLLNGFEHEEIINEKTALSDIEVFLHYLNKGYLPWNASGNIEKLLKNLIMEEPSTVSELIKKTGAKETVRKRLAFRFDNEMHKKLMVNIRPVEGGHISLVHKELVNHFLNSELVSKSKQELDNVFWFFIYNYLLANPNAAFNYTNFIKDILVQFSNHYNLVFPVVIVSLTGALEKTKEPEYEYLLNSLDEISKNFKIDTKQEQLGIRYFNRLTTPKKIALLIEYLNCGTIDPPVKGISQAHLDETFLLALRHEPEKLISALKKLNDTAISIAGLVNDFDVKVIYKVIQVVAPGYHYSIINFEKGFVAIHKKEQLVHASERDLSHTVLELILNALLYSRGTYFNQKSFLKNLIEKMAAHYNLAYQSFFEKIYKSAKAISAKSVRFHIFFQLIREIKEEDEGHEQKYHIGQKQKADTLNEQGQEREFLMMLENGFSVKGKHAISSLRAVQDYWKKYPVSAKVVLSKFLSVKENRKKLAAILSQEVFLDLIRLYHRRNIFQFDRLHVRFTKAGHHLSKYIPNTKNYSLVLKELFIWQAIEMPEGWNFDEEKMSLVIAKELALVYKIKVQLIIDSLPPIKIDVQNFQADEKAKPFISIVPDILNQILKNPEKVDLQQVRNWGFKDISEAVTHLVYYKRGLVLGALKKQSNKTLTQFLNSINEEPVQLLMDGIKTSNAIIVRELLFLINVRLSKSGFYKTSTVVGELARISLVFLLKNERGKLDSLLGNLEVILEKHNLPHRFFEIQNNQLANVAQNIDADIDRLEKSLQREVSVEEQKISKTKLVLEEMLKKISKGQPDTTYKFQKDTPMEEQITFIQNAGIVIFQAYLPYFFERCDLFENGKFKSEDAAIRGSLLLQYIFNEQTDVAEEEMILNKLLCGLEINDVLPNKIEPTENEKETISQMFDAIISHWSVIGSTTHEGFRGSWLHRSGKLSKKDEHWELTIEKMAFDILLDHAPFSLSPVKFSWMKDPIVVIWR